MNSYLKNKMKMWYLISLLVFVTFLPLNLSIVRGSSQIITSEKIGLEYTDHDIIFIDSDDDFVALGFLGSGTKEDPYLIENLNISERYVEDGIYIRDTTKYFIIQNCLIDGPEYGIYLRNVVGTGTIKNNIINYEGVMCIGLWMSPNILVEGNTVAGVIDLSDSVLCTIKGNTAKMIDVEDSQEAEILNNICVGSVGSGIRVTRCDHTILSGNICQDAFAHGISIIDSEYVTVTENECSENGDDGIKIKGVSDYSRYFTITYNELFQNEDDGLSLQHCIHGFVAYNSIYSNDYGMDIGDNPSNTVIIENLIQSNTVYGMIVTSDVSSISIYHNIFKYNGDGSLPQALDTNGNCYWYNETLGEGNYWSDWDGSGDYEIAGPPGTHDPYPLSEETPITTTPPETDDPDNGTETDDPTDDALSPRFMFLLIPLTLIFVVSVYRRKQK